MRCRWSCRVDCSFVIIGSKSTDGAVFPNAQPMSCSSLLSLCRIFRTFYGSHRRCPDGLALTAQPRYRSNVGAPNCLFNMPNFTSGALSLFFLCFSLVALPHNRRPPQQRRSEGTVHKAASAVPASAAGTPVILSDGYLSLACKVVHAINQASVLNLSSVQV